MSESHIFDLEAYASRIGYSGPLKPTLDVLGDLARCHVCSVPFENLSVLLAQGVNLAPEALEDKIVRRRRGGYCFEQNGFMLGILSQIGFDVRPLSGRVRIDSPRDFMPPRTHLFLCVTLEGVEWFFDAGVGSFSLTAPIRWSLDERQQTLHEDRRIVQEDGRFFHQAWVASGWADVYEFTGETMPAIDREVGNWWTSTNPNARFAQNLFCARAEPDGTRLAVLNDRLLHRRGPEVLKETVIKTAEQLLSVLRDSFGIHLPEGTRFGSGEKPWPTA